MLKSMTGYGRASALVSGKEILIEIKSVNSRFFDCTIKTPRGYSFLEERIKSELNKKGVNRGKIEIYVNINLITSEDVNIALNEGYAKAYLNALLALRDSFPQIKDDISVMSLARNSDIFSVSAPQQDIEKDWSEICPVLDEAIELFNASRIREGENLRADLAGKKEKLMSLAEKVREMQGNSVSAYKNRLYEKLLAVLAENDINIPPNDQRIITEVAIFADKVAIDEELVRLFSHFKAFDEILLSSEPVGKRLDFLLQEINREINTTGSKVSDSEITAIVVDMKCEAEKIREQIQNLE